MTVRLMMSAVQVPFATTAEKLLTTMSLSVSLPHGVNP